MSLVDNLSIRQDGGTSAAFDMNDKVEMKENPDEVGDNLVPETEFKENSGRRQRKLNKKCKEYKISLLEIRKQRLNNQLIRKCCAIDDLLYSKDHFVAVKEELRLFDSLYSQLLLCVKNIIIWLMLKILAVRNSIIGFKILRQVFLPSKTRLETGLRKLKLIENQENQRDQNPAYIASHPQVHFQVHRNQGLQKKKQN